MKNMGICLSIAVLSSCSTMNQSLEFGGLVGATSGALASYVGHTSAGGKANLEQVSMGAGIGIGFGLIASYFIHKSVEEDRHQDDADQTEMHFGDLPPSPFIVPKQTAKKGIQK